MGFNLLEGNEKDSENERLTKLLNESMELVERYVPAGVEWSYELGDWWANEIRKRSEAKEKEDEKKRSAILRKILRNLTPEEIITLTY